MSPANYQMSKNEKRIFVLMSVLLILFIAFLFFYHKTNVNFYNSSGTSCGLKQYFHLYCPGCGGTRALDAFLHGHLIHSFMLQPVIMYLFAYFLSYYIPALFLLTGLRKKKINYNFYLYELFGLLALIILFFIGRNLLLVYAGYDYIGECIRFWH